MKRTTILVPVLIAFVMGGLVGGRLLTADAEQPAPPAPADCEPTLAKREQELRSARRTATRAADRAKSAGAEAATGADETQRKIRELEKRIELERKRVEQLTRALVAPIPGKGLD